ncbi:MAG: prepilin peptidase [bacterium]|nr:prepilin peptidase [bacterium]
MLASVILFLGGTAIGSFLNVLALRYEDGGKIFRQDILTGRSRCPYCKKILRWYELIPLLSFLFQLGRCRRCGKALGWQYPIVEIAGGLIFALTPLYLPNAPIWIAILLTLLLITLVDLRLLVIPDQLNVLLALLAIGLFIKDFSGPILINHLLGAVVGFLIIGLLVLGSRGRGMGIGDWKFVAALGLLFGWPKILILLALAFVAGGVAGAVILLLRIKKLKDAIPFGPFLALASLLTIIFGDVIIRLYL